MKNEVEKFLDKATESIAAAQTLLKQGHTDFAISRAYYAMFYIAEGLLCDKGLRFRKHGGVHAAFGEHFAKSGAMDAKYHRWMLDAFDKRIQGDYGVDGIITLDDAKAVIGQAQEFLEQARRYL